MTENGFSQTTAAGSDEDLCRLAQQGDGDSAELLVRRYFKRVWSMAGQFFLQGGDREDLVQEGLLGLLRAIRTYMSDRQASFRTFALMCIRGKLMSAVKAANRDKHAPLNAYISIGTPFPNNTGSQTADFCLHPDFRLDPESLIIGREEESELAGTWKELLSDLEAEVMGYYLEGMSYQEIATVTLRSPKAVDNAVRRARTKLANLWRQQGTPCHA